MAAVFAAFATFFPPGGCKAIQYIVKSLNGSFLMRKCFQIIDFCGTVSYKRVNHTLGAFFSSGGLVVSRVMSRVLASKIILEPQLHARPTVMRIIHDIT